MYIYTKRLGLSLAALGLVMFMGASCSQQPTARNINVNANPSSTGDINADVKEFTMTSFFEMADNQPKPQFSIKEITVKKGDRVRIKVTNTKGSHDFNIDEYNIHQATPLDQQVTIEFTADKVGEFVYYCSMPNHRALGHWGTLKVTE